MIGSHSPDRSDEATGAAPPLPASPDADRLRQFCLGLLGVLDASGTGGGCAPELTGELVRALGGAIGGVAAGLRRDADALAHAVDELRRLPLCYLQLPPAAGALLAELTAANERANQVADALLAICSQTDAPPALPLPPLPTPRAISAPPPRIDAPTAVVPSVVAVPATEPGVGEEGNTQRAAGIFLQAEGHRKRREFERAEELYAEVIRIDPRFGPAFFRRGQVRLIRRAVESAVSDFDAALELDETAVEAWNWRGDAHVIAGRLGAAAADYERALALNPDLDRARVNLVAARRKLEADAAEAADSSPLPVAPPPTLPTAPGATAPERKGAGRVSVHCPYCGEAGEISWERLGKVLACGACRRHFGVSTDGKAVQLSESAGGKWVETRVVQARKKRRNRRVVAALLLFGLLLFAPLAYAGWLAARPAPEAGEPELPHELEARVETFTRGWVTNDVRLMRRLSTPTGEKLLFSWYTRHRPPLAFRSSTDQLPEGTRIEALVPPQRQTGRVTVRVRVSRPGQATVELALVWEERADAWYFVPPAR